MITPLHLVDEAFYSTLQHTLLFRLKSEMDEESSISTIAVRKHSESNTTASCHRCDRAPFGEAEELCSDLVYAQQKEDGPRYLRSRGVYRSLPDAPRIPLESSVMVPYCLDDLDTPQLNRLGKKLFWTGPSMRVHSLTKQLTIGRNIQLTENPSLHCIWTEDVLFLKPLPLYLCSSAFWEYILDPANDGISPETRKRLKETSLGFLRTYSRLIQRRSDFDIARKHGLFSSFDAFVFEEFVQFIMAFDSQPDNAVSIRWQVGEINLDTLNFYSVILLRRRILNRFESRYGAYFQRFFPVVLFMFALFSVSLSAMQVIMEAQPLVETGSKSIKRVAGLFIWFGTEVIGWSIAFAALFVLWWIVIATYEAGKRRGLERAWKKRNVE